MESRARVSDDAAAEEIIMSFQLLKANVAVALLAASSAPLFAASVAPQVHAPAQFRIDFTRPGGLPGAPRERRGIS